MALHRRSKYRRRRIRRAIYISAAVASGIAAGISWSALKPAESRRPSHSVVDRVRMGTGATRLVYPYSVVPGGISSRDDFRDVVARDGVAAAHYADISAMRLRQARLARPSVAYVSFRIDDAVYWTRKPVKIAAGEGVLADGEYLIRARCGNRVSARPRFPVAPREPPELLREEVEYPATPDIELPPAVIPPPIIVLTPPLAVPAPGIPDMPLVSAPVSDARDPELPTRFGEFLATGGRSTAALSGHIPTAEIAVVPEPSSVVLLGTAVLAFIVVSRRAKKRG